MFLSDIINKKGSSDNPARATAYSTEYRKFQKSTKHNTMNRAPPTRPWGQIFSINLGASPICPHQGKVDNHMKEGEGGGAGAFREIFSGGEEGNSSDR